MNKLSHINEQNQPSMVNVGGKAVTRRIARAHAKVALPPEVMRELQEQNFTLKKGPILQTAMLAGIQAAKRTHELIPLCHPIGLDDCQVDIQVTDEATFEITTTCEVSHKTGVEMEALTAASAAALTLYDMCKACSHDIVIREVRLLEKTGGKSDFRHEP